MVTTHRNRWWPTPEQREVLLALKAAQDKHKSAAEFVRQHLTFGAAKWSKILDALDDTNSKSYFDLLKDEPARQVLMKQLADDLAKVQDAMARPVVEREIYPLKKFVAMEAGIKKCQRIDGPQRLAKYLAPTGGGKTQLCEFLVKKFQAKVVEARDEWKKSYITFLRDIAQAIGCRNSTDNFPALIEDEIIQFAANRQTVLVIDECEFFGRKAINAIKLFLNKTRMTIVLCAIREAHDRWNRYYPVEAEQLSRRTRVVVELQDIEPEDALLFFAKTRFQTSREMALQAICEAASRFGHFELVHRVAERLEGNPNVDDKAVLDAIRGAAREMGKAKEICLPTKQSLALKAA